MPETTKCPTCDRDDFKNQQGMKYHHATVHGESIAKETVPCHVCGDPVEYYPCRGEYERRFCSEECENEWRSGYFSGEGSPLWQDDAEFTCEYCGDTQKMAPWQAKNRKYCSKECSYAAQKERKTTTITCEWCGDEKGVKNWVAESGQRFCSRRCSQEWIRKEHSVAPARNRNQLYHRVRTKISTESWNKVREENLGEECEMCESKENLELHHIIPVLEGGTNEEWNLLTLCRSCHGKAERRYEKLAGDPVIPREGAWKGAKRGDYSEDWHSQTTKRPEMDAMAW